MCFKNPILASILSGISQVIITLRWRRHPGLGWTGGFAGVTWHAAGRAGGYRQVVQRVGFCNRTQALQRDGLHLNLMSWAAWGKSLNLSGVLFPHLRNEQSNTWLARDCRRENPCLGADSWQGTGKGSFYHLSSANITLPLAALGHNLHVFHQTLSGTFRAANQLAGIYCYHQGA